jgi:hypothetical protein
MRLHGPGEGRVHRASHETLEVRPKWDRGGHRPGRSDLAERDSVSHVPVDVQSEIEIARPRHEIAAFACDPDNATAWYQNIKAVEWKTARPVAVGSQIAFVAEFLGRRLAYTYEVRELVPGERFVMSTAEGPFPMETTYTWEDGASVGTRMTLRNRGEPNGFAKLAAPVIAGAMRRANRKDLRRLKEILEQPEAR